MIPVLGDWGNNTGILWFPKRQGTQAGTQWWLRMSPNRVFREERFAGEESVSGMGITWYQSKTWLDLLSSPFFTSSHDAKHGIPLCNAPSSVQFRTDSSFLSITTETWDMLQAQQESKPSPSPTCPVSPSGTNQTTPTTTEQWRPRAATHRLWAGPWLQRGPSWILQALASRFRLPLSLPPLVPLPPPRARPENPTLFLHPTSEQLSRTWTFLARWQGQGYVPKAALEITYGTTMVAE